MHAKACAAYLAAILISALLMPTLLAASTPCFLNLWLTSPFAEYPSTLPQGTPAMLQATDVSDSRVQMLQHQAPAHQQVQKLAEGER